MKESIMQRIRRFIARLKPRSPVREAQEIVESAIRRKNARRAARQERESRETVAAGR